MTVRTPKTAACDTGESLKTRSGGGSSGRAESARGRIDVELPWGCRRKATRTGQDCLFTAAP